MYVRVASPLFEVLCFMYVATLFMCVRVGSFRVRVCVNESAQACGLPVHPSVIDRSVHFTTRC